MDRNVAQRMRRHRARLAAGKVPLTIEVNEVAVAEALITAGLLDRADAEDRTKLARALERVINTWVGMVTP